LAGEIDAKKVGVNMERIPDQPMLNQRVELASIKLVGSCQARA
jgi:hypothetical protein